MGSLGFTPQASGGWGAAPGAGGWLALWLLGPARDWEGSVPQAGGHTPHLLQGLNPLLEEPVFCPKPLCGERGEHVRARRLLLYTQTAVPAGLGHLPGGQRQCLSLWVSDSRNQSRPIPVWNGPPGVIFKNKLWFSKNNVITLMAMHCVCRGWGALGGVVPPLESVSTQRLSLSRANVTPPTG